ncbi:MAG: hypothetical protein Q6363_002005 [Candidatus Njordarchaeota archaeon]
MEQVIGVKYDEVSVDDFFALAKKHRENAKGVEFWSFGTADLEAFCRFYVVKILDEYYVVQKIVDLLFSQIVKVFRVYSLRSAELLIDMIVDKDKSIESLPAVHEKYE